MAKSRKPKRPASSGVERPAASGAEPLAASRAAPSRVEPRPRGTIALIVAALVLATVAAYTPVWQFDFVAIDDPQYVYANPHLADGLTATSVAWAFTSGREANWHPLTWLSHLIDVELYGLEPGGHHVTNLLLHVAGTLLLFGLFQRMTGAIGPSAFVAGVFAVHPLHVESVAWVAERKDVLSACLFFLTLHAYVSYVRRPGLGRSLTVAACFAAGLMSKPMLVTLPFVLLLLDYWPLGRRAIAEKLPLIAMAVASSVVTFLVQQRFGAVKTLESFPLGVRLQNGMASYADYLRDAIWPAKLGVFYPFPPFVPTGRVVVAAALIAALTAAAFFWRRRAPYAAVGWLWFVGMLVPVIGIVQVGGQARADRYMYLPLVGLSVAVAWLAADFVRRQPARRLVALGGTIAIAGLAVATHAQVQHWRNTVDLWSHTARVTDDATNFGVYFGLAEYLREYDRPAEAIVEYEAAIRRRPEYAESHYGLGQALIDAGQPERAFTAFAEAVRLKPDYVEARMALGLMLARAGRAAEAIPHFSEAVRLRPAIADGHRHLGLALAVTGRLVEALPRLSEAVRLDPASSAARNDYGLALMESGRLDEAAVQFGEALRLDPHSADAHHHVGELFLKQGRIPEALARLSEAVRLEPTFVDARLSLALAYARAGRRDEAARELREVLRIDPANARARAALAAMGGG
jgi:tetratricopeptide (TPR) repeat protein